MKKNKFNLIILHIILGLGICGFYAPNNGECTILTALEINNTKNPFKPTLPIIEEIIEILPEPTIIEIEEEPVIEEKIFIPVKEEIKIQPPELNISGLIWNTNRPQAIINDQIVTIGDTISNSKITNIHKDGVEIIYSGKNFTITIGQILIQQI